MIREIRGFPFVVEESNREHANLSPSVSSDIRGSRRSGEIAARSRWQ
jgi:hypothetical protein